MSNKVSIKDIAEKAGVSTALVSYVLNGKAVEMRVGKEKVAIIKKLALELNYQPNQIARSLRRGSTKTLGLIVADIANPFFGQLTRVIEDEAAKQGYTVLFGSSDENEQKLVTLIHTLLLRQVDGFIIVPTEKSKKQIEGLQKRGIPVVLMDRYFSEFDTSYICLDNYFSTFDATNFLIQKGYKKVAIVTYKSSLIPMQDRERGYKDAMTNMNLAENIKTFSVKYSASSKNYEDPIYEILKNRKDVDAIVFTNNLLSLAGLYAVNKLKLKIPEDLGFIGFDGSEAFDFFYSPITYIQQPINEIGSESVHALLGLIGDLNMHTQKLMKHNLIIGSSC